MANSVTRKTDLLGGRDEGMLYKIKWKDDYEIKFKNGKEKAKKIQTLETFVQTFALQ